eukprot:scaffold195437_cov17-Tisochrysis_lutea.AAC.1
MKRVVVVVSAVLFFKNPVSLMNWDGRKHFRPIRTFRARRIRACEVGSSIAIIGTYLYSLAMDKWTAETKAKKAAEKGQ